MVEKKHDSVGLSKEYIKEEIIKCASSAEYFLETYGFIRTDDKGIVPFSLFDYQKEIICSLRNNKYLAILKSRQIGVSTVIAGFIAWYVLFHKQRHIFIMATKREKASISFEMVKTFIKECSNWLKLYTVIKNNSTRFELSNGSWVKCQVTSRDTGVGEAASMFFIDEAALIDKLGEYWVGLFPTISTSASARCIMASTPRGVGNKFWEICSEGTYEENGQIIKGTNEFRVFRYPWQKRFTQEWFDKERIGKTPREIAQEYECRFLESGDTFLDSPSFDILKKDILDPIEIRNNLWVWKKPSFGSKYLISIDVSRGDSGDFSAFHVIDIESSEVVAEYKGKIKTNELGDRIIEVGTWYNTALLIPEANSFGDSVIQRILESGYENLYFSGGSGHYYIEHWAGVNNRSAKPGFHTTGTSRPAMLQTLEEYIRLKKITVHSKRLYDEFTTFIWHGQRAEATRGTSDDLILALSIGVFVKDRVFRDMNKREVDVSVLASGFVSSRTKFENTSIGAKNKTSEIEQLALLISRG